MPTLLNPEDLNDWGLLSLPDPPRPILRDGRFQP